MIKRYVCAVMRGRIHLDIYDTLRLKQTSLARLSGVKCTILRKLCFIFAIFCKKMQKNAKKCKKNLHISKICCNFAPEFEKRTKLTPKN